MTSRLETFTAHTPENIIYNTSNRQKLTGLDVASEIFEQAQINQTTTLENAITKGRGQTKTTEPSAASARVDSIVQIIPPFNTLPLDVEVQHAAYEEKLKKCLRFPFKHEDIEVLINSIPDNLKLWPDTLRMLRESCYLAAYHYKSYQHLSLLFPLFVRINGKEAESPKKMLNAIFTHLVKNVLDPTLKRQGLEFFLRDDIYPYISDQKVLLKEIETFLPVGDPLKLKLFHHQVEWDQEVWEQWINDGNLNEDQKLNLLIGEKAKSFVNPDKVLSLIQTQKIPSNCLLQLIEHLAMPYQHEICLALIKKLKQSKYPITACHNFFAYILKLEKKEIIQPEIIDSLKVILQGMQKKSKLALKDTVDSILQLVERMPVAQKGKFVSFYLNLLPFSFEEEYYNSNQRAALNLIAQANSCVCPFTNYLCLKDEASIDLRKVVNGQFFAGNKLAAKHIVQKLGELPVSCTYFEESYPEAFCNLYLDIKTSGLSYEEFIKALAPIDNTLKKALYVYYVIQNAMPSELNTCYKYFEELISENQSHILKHILLNRNLGTLVSSKNSSNALGDIIEAYILKVTKNIYTLNRKELLSSRIATRDIMHLHGGRARDFESFMQKLIQSIAIEIVNAPDIDLGEFFETLIYPFIEICSKLYKNSSSRYVKFPLEIIEELIKSYNSKKDIYYRYFFVLQLVIRIIATENRNVDRVAEMEALKKIYEMLLALEPFEDASNPIGECCTIKVLLNYLASHPESLNAFSDSIWSATIKWFTYTSPNKITLDHLAGFVVVMNGFLSIPQVVNKNFVLFVGHIERYTKLIAQLQFSNFEKTQSENILLMIFYLLVCARGDLAKARVCLPNIQRICQLIQPICDKKTYAEIIAEFNGLKSEISKTFEMG